MFQRPLSAQPSAWAKAGLSYATAAVLDVLWTQRAVPWAGLTPADRETWEQIWSSAKGLSTLGECRLWASAVRKELWGSEAPWDETAAELGDFESRAAAWARGTRLLGASVLSWIANDAWSVTAERWVLMENPPQGVAALGRAVQRRKAERALRLSRYADSVTTDEQLLHQRAENLCTRFGFASFVTAGDLTVDEASLQLAEVEQGLLEFASAMQWSPEEIGGGFLNLAIEMEPRAGWAGAFDPLTQTLALSRREGWGSFAHEWAHALDHALGRSWQKEPTASRSTRFASEVAEDATFWLPEEHRLLRQKLATRDDASDGTGITVHRRILAAASLVFGELADHVPAVWSLRLPVRLQALSQWLDAARRPGLTPEKLRTRWNQWRLGNRIAWSHPETPHVQMWRRRWEEYEVHLQSMLFGPSLNRQSWAVWAEARDRANGEVEWNKPSERFARSFHAYVRSALGRATWAAGDADRPDLFPVGVELQAHRGWWSEVLPLIRRHWSGGIP